MALLSRRLRMALGLGLAGSAVGCAVAVGLGLLVEGRPRFDHGLHVKDQGLDCDSCHRGAKEAEAAGMPALSQCMLCHGEMDEAKPPERRASAFFPGGESPVPRAKVLAAGMRFSHAVHAAKEVECARCHGDPTAADWVPRKAGRQKDDCMGCHVEKRASNECATCHDEWRRDTPPRTHAENWRRSHGGRARAESGASEDRCELCHQESACASCHRSEAPASHTTHFRHRGHGVMASMDRELCWTCHQPDSCNRCHSETAPRSHRGSWGAPRATHCFECHDEAQEGRGCFLCHDGTLSHDAAPSPPSWHVSGMNCRMCHGQGQPLPHVDNGANCEGCHKIG